MKIIIIGAIIIVAIVFVISLSGGDEMQFLEKITPTFLQGGNSNSLQNPIRTVNTIPQQFSKWRVTRHDGNESILYNVTIDQRTGEACLIKNFDTSMIREECKTDESNKTTCSDVTYNQPVTVKLTKNKQESQLSKTGNEFCYTLDKTDSLYYKFGEESIIIVGDTSYASTDLNVTQQTGFAHLNISGDPLYNALNLYMSFDSNVSTTTEYDYSRFGNDGTYVGNAKVDDTDSIFGRGTLLLDGAGDVDLGDTLDPGTGSLTASVWFKVDNTGTGTENIIEKRGFTPDLTEGWRVIYRTAPNFIRLQIREGSTTINVDGDINVSDGEWHHVVQVYNRTRNATLYIDGVVDNTADMTSILGGTVNTQQALEIGGSADGTSNNDFTGSIDEVMVWKRALSPSEVTLVFNNQSVRFAKLGYQNFTDNNVSVIGTEDTLDINLQDYQNYFNTNISVSIDEGTTWTNLTGLNTSGLTFSSSDANFLNISFIYQSDGFYSPLMIGNITLDSYVDGGGGDTCTYSSGDFDVMCSDNCEITSPITIDGDLKLTGTGTFTVRDNITFAGADRSIYVPAQCNVDVVAGGGFI